MVKTLETIIDEGRSTTSDLEVKFWTHLEQAYPSIPAAIDWLRRGGGDGTQQDSKLVSWPSFKQAILSSLDVGEDGAREMFSSVAQQDSESFSKWLCLPPGSIHGSFAAG